MKENPLQEMLVETVSIVDVPNVTHVEQICYDIEQDYNFSSTGKASQIAPTNIPPLPSQLVTRVQTMGAIKNQSLIIQHYASYLLDTQKRPSKEDYKKIAETILKLFPALKGGKDDIVSDTIFTTLF